MKLAIALVLLAAVAACGGPGPTTVRTAATLPTLGAGELALPTEQPVSLPAGAVEACGGVGIDAVLHGDPADPRVAWLVSAQGTRIDVEWPRGYRARFDPALEIVDGSGTPVLGEGAHVTGGCVTGDEHVLLLMPPFR